MLPPRPSILANAAAIALALVARSVDALPSSSSRPLSIRADDAAAAVTSLTCGPNDGCTNLGNSPDPLAPDSITGPIITLSNGSYAGLRLDSIDPNSTLSGFGLEHGSQDLFLGMPFARQPTGDRRFARPQSLAGQEAKWDGVRSAQSYSPACYSQGGDNDFAPPYVTYRGGEECLTVNVVRPSSAQKGDRLPVFVWVYGGGFQMGSNADRRYNGSFLIDHAVGMGKPIIFASLNYRTGILGFPVGDVAKEQRIENLGLYDQRLALHWIRENVEAFGGDPDKVTIVGKSAGGASMLFHNTAFGGRDDGLFRSTIVESGYYATLPVTPAYKETNNGLWNNFTTAAGCPPSTTGGSGGGGNEEQLRCLRSLPLEKIAATLSSDKAFAYPSTPWIPQVDGNLVQKDLQRSFLDGDFVKNTKIVMHNNLNEGLSFGPPGFNTSDQILAAVKKNGGLSPEHFTELAQKALLDAYPAEEGLWPPYQAGDGLISLAGRQQRRTAAIFGDLRMTAPRREVSELLAAEEGTTVYSSRFDQAQYNGTILGAAQHFVEVAYVFRNPLATQNALGPRKYDVELANQMAEYWISFVATGDPNAVVGQQQQEEGEGEGRRPQWPKYEGKGGEQMRFKNSPTGERTRTVRDTYRKEGIDVLNQVRAGSWKPSSSSSKSKREEL